MSAATDTDTSREPASDQNGWSPREAHHKRSARSRVNWRLVITLGSAGIVAYLVLAPLTLLVLASFKSKQDILPFEGAPFTLSNYADVYLDPYTYELLANTLTFGVGALAIGIGGAVALSWIVERTNVPLKSLIYATVLIPLAVPGMLEALAWIFLLDSNIGLLNIIIRSITGIEGSGPFNIYSLYGMILVQGIGMIPTAFLMISAAFRSMDPDLEEASRIFGRGILSTLARITVPLVRPAIFAATIYFFVSTIEAFEVPGVLGLTANVYVFSTRIYAAAHPNPGLPDYGTASTLSMLLLVLSAVLLWLYGRMTRRANKFATITGKGYRTANVDIGAWRFAALAGYLCYFILAVGLPFLILLWASLQVFYAPPSWSALSTVTLDNYREVLGDANFYSALTNTLLMSVVTATATMFLVSMVAWIIVRVQGRGGKILDFLVFLPQAVPGLIIGLSVLFLYLSFPNPLYGTIWVIAIALVTKYMAFGSRTMNAGLIQIHPELEEAAQICGSSWMMTYRRVLFPLLLPAFVNGWIWVATHSMRELSAALMLGTPTNQVLSTMVWKHYQNGNFANAAVIGVILIVSLAAFIVAGRWLVVRRGRTA
jgi:iron(III) transport system permease protein